MGKGPIPARVMLIGESPGDNEDRKGEPFIGKAGDMLRSIASNVRGFPSIEDCFITNIFKCHPPNNAKPKNEHLDICSQRYLRKEIKLVQPELIICLGALSAKALVGNYNIKLDSLRNIIHYTTGPLPEGYPFIVTYHPAATFHMDYTLNHIVSDFEYAVSILKGKDNEAQSVKRYRKCDSLHEIANVNEAKCLDLDLETDGIDAFTKKSILSLQLSIRHGEGYYLDWNEVVRQELHDYLRDHPNVIVNGHNVKHDLKWLRSKANIPIPLRVNDTLINIALLDENFPDKSLDIVSASFTEIKGHKDELKSEIKKYVKLHKDQKESVSAASKRLWGEAFKSLPYKIRISYGCADADATGRLRKAFRPKLKEQKLTNLNWLMNNALRLYVDMECNGVAIDTELRWKLDAIYTEKLSNLEHTMKLLAPALINPRSPKQLIQVLYGDWKLEAHPVKVGHKTIYNSSSKAALEMILLDDIKRRPREFITSLLEYRKASKLHGTYIEGMPRFLRKGLIHATWNLTGTETGRSSCKEPNLQQIPRKGEVKKLFRSRWDTGYVLQSDCSQGELRIEAHSANEPTLIALFNRGVDIHTATAALIFNCSEHDITEEQRYIAKTINFAILYGSGARTIAASAKIIVDDAYKYIHRWHKTYPRIKEHFNETLEFVLQNNYVEGLFNRRRRIMILEPESDRGLSQIRQAFNSPIQGGLGDLNKLIGINIWSDLKKYHLEEKVLFTMEVHDAWNFDIKHKKYIKPAVEIIQRNYEQVDTSRFGFKFKVPIKNDMKVGKNWLEMEEVRA
jgi:DNA polymerase-1